MTLNHLISTLWIKLTKFTSFYRPVMTLNLKIVTLVICFTKSQLEDIRSQMWEIRLEDGRYKVIIASFFLNFEAKAFFHNLLLYYSFLSEESVLLAIPGKDSIFVRMVCLYHSLKSTACNICLKRIKVQWKRCIWVLVWVCGRL